jgi:hypothetical protein
MPVETSKDAQAFHERLDEAFPEVTKIAHRVADEIGADYDELKRQLHARPVTSRYPATMDAAFALLQTDIPRVLKGETAKIESSRTGKTHSYQYADLTDVTDAILPRLGALGLSWRCKPTLMQMPGEAGYRFVLHYRMAHVSGETDEGFVPLPDRTDPQDHGSAITYWRRYTLCAVTGVAPGGDDEDGAAAKQASRQTESLAQASRAGLTDTDRREIESALTWRPEVSQVHGPNIPIMSVGKLPELWARIVKAGAAERPSPFLHPTSDQVQMDWRSAFGYYLAQRIDAVRTPDEWKAMQADLVAAGGGNAISWKWEDVRPADRFKARGKAIGDLQAATVKELEERIASATTWEHLDRVIMLVDEAHDAYKIHDPWPAQLDTFIQERRTKIETADTSEIQGEAANAATPEPAEPDYSDGYYSLRLSIWSGEALGVQIGDIDGAYERNEISADEKVELHQILSERAEPADGGMGLVNFLDWQIETCLDETELDAVRDVVVNKNAAGLIPEAWSRKLYANVTARRLKLKGKTSDY